MTSIQSDYSKYYSTLGVTSGGTEKSKDILEPTVKAMKDLENNGFAIRRAGQNNDGDYMMDLISLSKPSSFPEISEDGLLKSFDTSGESSLDAVRNLISKVSGQKIVTDAMSESRKTTNLPKLDIEG